MISFPNAKINLGLHVVEQRADGFHNIETALYPVPMCDVLEIVPSEKQGVELTSSGIPIIPGDPASNLVTKSCQLISSSIQHPASSIQIHLHKVIPMGAGLGGGSSDGAFTLKMLNDIYCLDLSVPQLQDLARQLGSDCAFFIESTPVIATGKGDQFEPIDIDLSGFQIVVVVPPLHCSTPEAYAMVEPKRPKESIKEIITMPVEQWKSHLVNDFEESAMSRYPVIREIKEGLYSQGAIYAAMSGSGSAVFGIFSPQSAVHSLQMDASFKTYFM